MSESDMQGEVRYSRIWWFERYRKIRAVGVLSPCRCIDLSSYGELLELHAGCRTKWLRIVHGIRRIFARVPVPDVAVAVMDRLIQLIAVIWSGSFQRLPQFRSNFGAWFHLMIRSAEIVANFSGSSCSHANPFAHVKWRRGCDLLATKFIKHKIANLSAITKTMQWYKILALVIGSLIGIYVLFLLLVALEYPQRQYSPSMAWLI